MYGSWLPHQVEDAEQPEVAMRTDAGMLRCQTLVMCTHHRVHRGGVLDEVILLVHVSVASDAASDTGWLE